jgi:hypothetical protein
LALSTVPRPVQVGHAEVLPLAFLVQGVEGERGFARTGEAGEDDELLLRDGDRDVLEIVQARALDED